KVTRVLAGQVPPPRALHRRVPTSSPRMVRSMARTLHSPHRIIPTRQTSASPVHRHGAVQFLRCLTATATRRTDLLTILILRKNWTPFVSQPKVTLSFLS